MQITKNNYGNLFAKEDTCQNLTNINAACDIYGIEITATNPKMLKISSQDPKYQSILHKNFTKNKDGTYELKPNSLASKKLIAKYAGKRPTSAP